MDFYGFITDVGAEITGAAIIASAGAFYFWFRSRKIIKSHEYVVLKKIEIEHQKCQAKYDRLKIDYDSLSETCAPYLAQKRKELASRGLTELTSTSEEDIKQRRLNEALAPLDTNPYFDPRVIQKKVR